MPKTKQQKEQMLADLKQGIRNAKSATLSSFSALSVSDDQELRAQMRENSVDYWVVKKTLLQKAMQELDYNITPVNLLEKNISIAISDQDEISAAKVLDKFANQNENIEIVGGFLEGSWMDKVSMTALAKLPSKEELIAKTVGTIKAPLNGLVNSLAGNLRNLVGVLNAISDQKQ